MYGLAAKRASVEGSSRRRVVVRISVGFVLVVGAVDVDVMFGRDVDGAGRAVSTMRSRQGGNWCTEGEVQLVAR